MNLFVFSPWIGAVPEAKEVAPCSERAVLRDTLRRKGKLSMLLNLPYSSETAGFVFSSAMLVNTCRSSNPSAGSMFIENCWGRTHEHTLAIHVFRLVEMCFLPSTFA